MGKTNVSFQLTPEALTHPQSIYQFLRSHSSYLYEAGSFWIVIRYDQVQSLLTNPIANGIFALLSHTVELVKLQKNPSLINAAIEEILRFDTSVPFTYRITTRPIWVGQYQIPARQLLALGLSAAKHDETIFSEP